MRSVASFNAPWPTACAAGASSALDAYHTPPPPPATPFAVGDDFLLHPELSTAPVDDINLIRLQARRGSPTSSLSWRPTMRCTRRRRRFCSRCTLASPL